MKYEVQTFERVGHGGGVRQVYRVGIIGPDVTVWGPWFAMLWRSRDGLVSLDRDAVLGVAEMLNAELTRVNDAGQVAI